MPYFRKGVGLVRVPYKTSLQARSANLDFVAGKYLIQPMASGVDVITSVTVNDKSIGKALITNPASLTSINLPVEYDSIGPKAFNGCTNLEAIYIYTGQIIPISEDAIPSGCTMYVDNEFLADYQAEHPTLTFAGFDSGYIQTVPYVEGITPTTLTAQYVNDLVASLGNVKNNVGKVIVPAYFTTYENGSIQAFENGFQNLQGLQIPYDNGNMVFGLSNGNIVSIDGFILNNPIDNADERIVYSKNYVTRQGSASVLNALGKKCLFYPKITFRYAGYDRFLPNGDSGLRYSAMTQINAYNNNVQPDLFGYANTFQSCNTLECAMSLTANSTNNNCGNMFGGCTNLKKVVMDCSYVTRFINVFSNCTNLEEVILNNLTLSTNISASIKFTRQSLVNLLNSLGTPSSTQYLTIGDTNLAKLTAEDIQIAYDKMWVINPTPSPFYLSINNVGYAIAYGTTWESFAKANPSVFHIVNGIIYDQTETYVVIGDDGNIALSQKPIRAGVTYSFGAMPALSTLNIPFVGNATLTKQYVESVLDSTNNIMSVGKIVIDGTFIDYEEDSLQSFVGLRGIDSNRPNNVTQLWLGNKKILICDLLDSQNIRVPSLTFNGNVANFYSGVKITSPVNFTIKARLSWNGSGNGEFNFAGNYQKTPNFLVGVRNQCFWLYSNTGTTKWNWYAITPGTMYDYEFNAGNGLVSLKVNSVDIGSAYSDLNYANELGVGIGGRYYNDAESPWNGTIEYFEIVNNSNGEKANILPCYNLLQNYYGLFDTVAKTELLMNGARSNVSGSTYSVITYYYNASDLVDEYDSTKNQIGYLDYDGTNIPTFSGYTDTWYSDEDCTTSIAASAFVSGTRYYVKLTTST